MRFLSKSCTNWFMYLENLCYTEIQCFNVETNWPMKPYIYLTQKKSTSYAKLACLKLRKNTLLEQIHRILQHIFGYGVTIGLSITFLGGEFIHAQSVKSTT